MIITWGMCTAVAPFNDPETHFYVQDPLIVSFLAFCLCGSIAYSFTMLFDHTADVLLYCYAFNKRFKKHTVEKYVPDELRNVVGAEDREYDEWGKYGRAMPPMYLATWMATGNKDEGPKEREIRDKWGRNLSRNQSPNVSQAGSRAGSRAGSQASRQNPQGGYNPYGGYGPGG